MGAVYLIGTILNAISSGADMYAKLANSVQVERTMDIGSAVRWWHEVPNERKFARLDVTAGNLVQVYAAEYLHLLY